MKWSIAIFSSRESLDTLVGSVGAVLGATTDAIATIDVVVNGNQALSSDIARYVEALRPGDRAATLMRVWYIPVADKAHAWNQYLRDIWEKSDVAFFVDGYTQVMPDALQLISEGLRAKPNALAASGVPSIGRSSSVLREQMLREGGLHGNLFAVRGDVLEQMRTIGFQLPVGMYRVDGTLGAVICFALDPAKNDWDPSRVLVHPRATWLFNPLNWRSAAHVRAHFNRVMRQAQGVLENLAVREHLAIQKRAPQDLPRTSAELVLTWIRSFPLAAAKAFVKNPICLIAAHRLRRPRDWTYRTAPAVLVSRAAL